MKKRHLLFSVFTLFFWSTSFGQTSKDSMLVVKALTEINEGNITNANKLLQNVSSSGKKSENFLSCRGVYYEKSSS